MYIISLKKQEKTYIKLTDHFIFLLKNLSHIDFTYNYLANYFGVSTKTIQRCYKQLRLDKRFYVGKAIRRDKSKLYHTVKVKLVSWLKSSQLEYVHEEVSLFNYYIYLQKERLTNVVSHTTKKVMGFVKKTIWGQQPPNWVFLRKKRRTMNFENDSQPKYGNSKQQKQEQHSKDSSGRANVSAYKLWQPDAPRTETKAHADMMDGEWIKTKEAQEFIQLVGIDVARDLCRRRRQMVIDEYQ